MKQPTMINCQDVSCGQIFLSETGMQKYCPSCRKRKQKARAKQYFIDNPDYMPQYKKIWNKAAKDTEAECKRIRLERLRQLAVEAGLIQSEVAV